MTSPIAKVPLRAELISFILLIVLGTSPAYLFRLAFMQDIGQTIVRGEIVLLMLLSLSVLMQNVRSTLMIVKNMNKYYFIFLLCAVISLAWSIDVENTMNHLSRLPWIVGSALAFSVIAGTPNGFEAGVRPPLTTILVGSLIFGMIFPEFAIHQEKQFELLDSWRGLTWQKNIFGEISATSAVLWAWVLVFRKGGRAMAIGGLSISVVSLALSRSSTSAMGAIAGISLILALKFFASSSRRVIPKVMVAVTIIVIIFGIAMIKVFPELNFLLSPIPALTGKDLTFSGRSQIWDIIVAHVGIRSWFGSGFGAYWKLSPIPGTESFVMIQLLSGFYPGSSHNGFLEILNDLGFVGFSIFLLFVAKVIRDIIKLIEVDLSKSLLYFSILTSQIIFNFSESGWFNTDSFQFAVLSMMVCLIGRDMAVLKLSKKKTRNTYHVPQ